MPVYNFIITCVECDGTGEYEYSMDPYSDIHYCEHCHEGWVEVTESYDCVEDLKQDYPDATDIITDEE